MPLATLRSAPQGALENGTPALDEVFVTGGRVHLEPMNYNAWWMGIEAGGKSYHLNFGIKDGRLTAFLADQGEEAPSESLPASGYQYSDR